ncbi:MAG: hypothetical protein M1832_001407 [Thelocarpon impressellum]|nr:MAG: hypothetical protein M1832_001407 [Thelocarpon impressellum]
MDFSKLKVVGLKAELKARSLPQSGLKQDLIDRLQAYEAQTHAQPLASSQPVAPAQPAGNDSRTESRTHQSTAKALSVSDLLVDAQPVTADVPATYGASQPIQTPALPDAQPDVRQRDIVRNTETPLTNGGSTKPQRAEAPIPTPSAPAAAAEPASTPSLPATASEDAQSLDQPISAAPRQASPSNGEVAEDTRKRKRRSVTPPPEEERVAQKKSKQADEGPSIHLQEDAAPPEDLKEKRRVDGPVRDVVMADTAAEPEMPAPSGGDPVVAKDGAPAESAPALEADIKGASDGAAEGIATSKAEQLDSQSQAPAEASSPREAKASETSAPAEKQGSPRRSPSSPSTTAPQRAAPGAKDARFQSLFAGQGSKHEAQALPAARRSADLDEPTAPAIHAATRALYIKDFMRPLQAPTLRDHLAALASAPGAPPDADIITNFHLDAIRTHALVSFSTVAAASRVRSALHMRVWPEERTRKPLWVDFIPEDKVGAWIDLEQPQGSGRSSHGGKRWEVVYEAGAVDHEEVTAQLREVGASGPAGSGGAPILAAGRGVHGAPLGPRGQQHPGATAPADGVVGASTRAAAQPQTGVNLGFSALDTLFRSTTAKPKLYFLPVAKDLAEKRLDALDRETARGGGRARGGWGGDELRRYTFEDADKLVDRGPDIGGGSGGGGNARGGHGGGYGGYQGGGYRGGGGGWRGRGRGGGGGPHGGRGGGGGGGDWRNSGWRGGDRRERW